MRETQHPHMTQEPSGAEPLENPRLPNRLVLVFLAVLFVAAVVVSVVMKSLLPLLLLVLFPPLLFLVCVLTALRRKKGRELFKSLLHGMLCGAIMQSCQDVGDKSLVAWSIMC